MDKPASTPLVSAIIPTLNRPHLLLRAIKSVLSQTYPAIELIVVDDGSDCDIESIVRRHIRIQNCRFLTNFIKGGSAAARNRGFEASTGQLIGFLDDDDEWLPNKVEKQVEVFKTSSNNVGIVCTHDIQIRNQTRHIRRRYLEGNVYGALCKDHLVGNTSNPLIKRQVLDEVHGFDEGMPAAQDTDLWLRIAQRSDFRTVNEPLVVVHRDGRNRIAEDYHKQLRGTSLFLRKHWKDLHRSRKWRLIGTIARLSLALARDRVGKLRPTH